MHVHGRGAEGNRRGEERERPGKVESSIHTQGKEEVRIEARRSNDGGGKHTHAHTHRHMHGMNVTILI